MRKGKMINHTVALVLLLVSVCCTVVVIISMFNLPEIPNVHTGNHSQETSTFEEISKFGEMMIDMLPNDLSFTVFVPSEKAFERDLKLRVNHSFTPEEKENTYATVSRILGFSAVPRKIFKDSVSVGKEVSYDSISGFALYISKDLDGALVVNRVKAKRADIRIGELVVHIIDGVIMDAEFEYAVRPYDDDDGDQEE